MDCNDLKTECSCKAEYANDPKGSKYCDVERKKQLTAFLLELFVGFGAIKKNISVSDSKNKKEEIEKWIKRI